MLKRLALAILISSTFFTSCLRTPLSSLDSEITKVEPGHGEGHRIVRYERGSGYFKERDSCEGLVPVVTHKLNKYLGRTNVPPTTYRKVEGKDGVVMRFIPNSEPFNDPSTPEEEGLPAELWAEKLSVGEYSDLQLTQFLSGAQDRNLTNFLLQENKVYAVDNDGDFMKFGRFPGWPFHLAHTDSFKDYDFSKFPFDRVKTQTREEFIKESAGLYPDFINHPVLNHRYRIDVNEFTWVHWEGGIWIQKERNFYEPHSTRVVRRKSLTKLENLAEKEVKEWIEPLPCPRKSFYLKSFMEKKKQLLNEIKGKNGYRIL